MFFDGGGDDVGDFVHLGDDLGDFRDGLYGALGVALDGFDFSRDVAGRCCCGFGEFFHFVCDDGEAFPGFAGSCGFDGCVEGEQVGLLGDGGDEFDDVADLGAGFTEFGDGDGGGGGDVDGIAGDASGFDGVLGDFADGCGHLFGTGCDGLEVS